MAFFHDDNANVEMNGNRNNKLWIFGYGSLLWNPGFGYADTVLGYVKGYSRRFWQGNTVHRGTPDNPGRVVTLVQDTKEITWGRAYEPTDAEIGTAFNYLDRRECQLGGYETTIVQFYPKDPKRKPFPVLLYVGNGSDSYLGPAPMRQLAQEIVSAKGNCGTNVEYVIRLANFMRETLPDIADDHLYGLEEHVRAEIKRNNLDFNLLMGNGTAAPRRDSDGHNNNRTEQRSLFTERVVPNKLRCVKI